VLVTEKIALISGASREQGLGFAVARELAGRGFHVLVTSRDAARAEPRAEQLRSEGSAASALALDVTDSASIQACVEAIGAEFGRLDVLINNHSTVPDFDAGSILDVDPDQARDAYNTDVIGTWQLTRALLPLLRKAPAARIVNVSSQDALRIASAATGTGTIASPGFSMAKYALNALTTALARALRETSILVNAVDPGETATHPETGDEHDARPAADSAQGVVWAAVLDAGGPSGGFFRDGRPVG
jgi:NAD(P)-dependent dehydrogenase (short-subunit alcohol dehydrogenase family)